MGRWITLHTSDGKQIDAYRADPAGKPRGGLVVIQEIFGVNSHIRSVADGFAADGYLAIAPAVFDRQQPKIELGYTADDIARGRDLKAQANADHALADIAAARDIAAEAGKVGVIGYCWGGYLAWLAAARVPKLACAICYYGGGMTDAIGENPKVPVLAHFGEKDHAIPLAGVRKLAEAHPSAKVHLYPAEHGFNCDHRGSYDAAAAKTARERTIAFLREQLG